MKAFQFFAFFRRLVFHSQKSSLLASKFIFIISQLQITSICFHLFILTTSDNSKFQSLISTGSNLITGFHTSFENIETIHIIILIISLIFHSVILLLIIAELYLMRNPQKISRFFCQGFNQIVKIMFYFLSLPLLNISLRFLKHEFSGGSPNISLILLGLIFIVLNFLISGQIFINITLKTQNKLSSPGNQYLYCLTAQKFLFSIFLILSDDAGKISNMSSWLLNIYGVLISVIGLYYLLTKAGFFYMDIQKLALALQSLALTMSAINLINKLGSSAMGIVEFFILVLIVWIPIKKLMANLDVEIQMSKISKIFTKQNLKYFEAKHLFTIYEFSQRKSAISPDDWKANLIDFRSLVFEKLILNEVKSFEARISDILSTHLEKMAEVYTCNEDRLIVCFLNQLLANDFKAYSMITCLLLGHNLSFNQRITAVWIIDQIALRYQKGESSHLANLKLVDYFKNLKKQEDITSNMVECLQAYKKFYLTLNEITPSLYNVSQLSSNIQSILKVLDAKWNSLSQEIIENSPQFIADYAMFNLAIKIEREKGVKLLKLHVKITQRKKMMKKSRRSNHEVMPCDCLFLELSMEKSHLGNILCGNFRNIQAQLGYDRVDLVGKNISVLFPDFLRSHFAEKIKNFVENYGSHSEENEACLLLHNEGYACTYNFSIMIHPVIENQIKILCKFAPEKLKKDIIIISGNKLEAATKQIFNDMKEHKHKTAKLLEDELIEMGYTLEPISKNCRVIEHKSLSSIESDFNLFDVAFREQSKNEWDNMKYYFVHKEENKAKILSHSKFEEDKKTKNEEIEDIPEEHVIDSPKKIVYEKIPTPKTIEKKLPFISETFSDSFTDNTDGNIRRLVDAFSRSKRSVASGETEIPQIQIKKNFELHLQKIRLFKFQEKNYLMSSFFFLLTSMAITLLLSYINAIYLFDQVNVSVNLIKNLYGRTASVTDIARTAYAYTFINLYYSPGQAASAILNPNIAAALPRVKVFSDYNRNVRNFVNELDDNDLKEAFFQKNVRVYYDNLDSILNASTYTWHDSFEAANNLISAAQTFGKKMQYNTTENIEQAIYIMILCMNDLFIVYQDHPSLIQNALDNILDRTNRSTSNAFLVSGIALGLYLITVVYVFRSHYKVSKEFLVSIINVSPDFIQEMVSELDEFERKLRGAPSGVPYRSFSAAKSFLGDKKKKNEKRLGMKNGNKKFLFLDFFVLKTFFMILLILPSTILLWITYSYPADTDTLIDQNLKDLEDLNEIGVGFAELITDSNYFDYVPFLFTHNTYPEIAYENDINGLSDLISTERGFSQRVLNYLNRDLCLFFIKTPLVSGCYQIISGQAQKGIYNVAYFTKTFYRGMKTYSETITDYATRSKSASSTPMKIEATVAALNAVLPAVRFFSEEITVSLINELETKIKNLISLFGSSVALGGILLIIAFRWIKEHIINGRTKIANTLLIVPLEFIAANKNLRFYLIKESKEFLRASKEILLMLNKN